MRLLPLLVATLVLAPVTGGCGESASARRGASARSAASPGLRPPPGVAGRPLPYVGRGCVRTEVPSQGYRARAVLCLPPRAPRPVPAVVVLYGCGGFGSLDLRLARALPEAAFASLYLDTYSLTPTPGPPAGGFCRGVTRSTVRTWRREVLDAVALLRRTRGIDPRRIGAAAWSLGAGLAVHVAAVDGSACRPRPFAALALFSGFAPPDVTARAAVLPPTIALSGGRGDSVPAEESVRLHAALRAAHVRTELLVWPGSGGTHGWKGRQGRVGIARALGFLRSVLGR